MNYTIISDKDNTARRQSISKRLDLLGGVDKFTNAIMATNMPEAEVYSYATDNCYLTKGEVGCVLSHKKVYANFLKTDEKSVFIFEDDAVFTDICTNEILDSIQKFIEELDFPAVIALQKNEWEKKEKLKVNDEISIYSCHKFFCTHGYIINREAAKNIIEVQTPIRFEIDAFDLYSFLGIMTLYSVSENLVLQSEQFESTIEEERFCDGDATKWKIKNKRRVENYNLALKRISLKQNILGKKNKLLFWWHEKCKKYKARINFSIRR